MIQPPARRTLLWPCVAVGAALACQGCFARPEGDLRKQTDDDAGSVVILIETGAADDVVVELPPIDPHGLLGVDPAHGPFTGGRTALVRGNGFTSSVRLWFGGTELPKADVVPVDPGRVQVTVPPGSAGPADVTVQNGDDASTRRTLPGGYAYDAFYAEPDEGPTSGGTIVTLHGQGTKWNDQTEVLVDLAPCEISQVKSVTELDCKTPQGTPGAKPIRVTTKDGVSVDVLDAFVYGDSDNGFKGGLSGQPLGKNLSVLVLDGYFGAKIPGATVVAGDSLGSALVQTTDSAGITTFQGSLGPKRSVTVAKKCFQPVTFVDVPVDKVTAYLDPVLSPACASEGDAPPVGGTPSTSTTVTGQLVWPDGIEFQRALWTNVPDPVSDDESQTAYVFALASDATRQFSLPDASLAVTPESSGTSGYEFTYSGPAGNLTLYAIAGIENRTYSPPSFIAYAMGVQKGVQGEPGKTTKDVYVHLDLPLDHAIEMTLDGPTPTLEGPDQVRATVAIGLGTTGFVILPAGQQIRLLPVGSGLEFVGVPPLSGQLVGGRYISTASAHTGAADTTPRSVVGLYATQSSSQLVTLDEFVEIPRLDEPGTNGGWDGTALSVGWAPGGASVDLTVFEIVSGGGLVAWTVAAPAGVQSITLPDPAVLSELELQPGSITITVSAAHIDDFDYGALRYRQLDKRGWTKWATDVFYAHY